MSVKKIGILYHPKVASTKTKAEELGEFLKTQGVSAWVCSAWDSEEACTKMNGTELLLTVGGDGTILRAVQAVIPGMTPIVGVNQGKLGFLTELANGEAEEKLPFFIAGQGWTDERAILQAELKTEGKEPQVFHALNDVVVARGAIARLVNIEAAIDGHALSLYRADAIIAATATGSTGYALAARGPIMYPQSQDFLLIPVAPHLSPAYPIVVSAKSEVVLRVSTFQDATLSIDGNVNLTLVNGDSVTIRRSPYIARFRRIRQRDSFFSTLEEKLKGKTK
jgi:NAD+ kinase